MIITRRDRTKKDWLHRCDYIAESKHPEQWRIAAAKRMEAWDRGVTRTTAVHWTADPTYFAPRKKGNQLREPAISKMKAVYTKTSVVELDLSML